MKAPKNNLCRAASFELRATDDADGLTLEGYAAVFDTATRIDSWEGTFDETIARGAFAKTIKERKPVLQFDHGHDTRTGSVPIGAIEQLSEDEHGLLVRARLHDNDLVRPIRDAIASGAIDGMSFRFRVTREEWDEGGDIPERTIREVELFELGPVVFPAYAATSVGVRSLLAGLDDDDRAELVREIADEVGAALTTTTTGSESGTNPVSVSISPDAVREDTSGNPSDAGSPATSESPNNHADLRFALLERFGTSAEEAA